MTAQIILFPGKPADRERLAMVGRLLSDAIPTPARDLEFDMLLTIGGKLLDNLNDYRRPDCSSLMDYWIDRLDGWDGDHSGREVQNG